ncbi:hypothetical protein J7J90_04760 [Candidatus Micrarchaeota archaeon]|nr:hypothetical protein [Candidatus Micrarchaeota archaeon]
MNENAIKRIINLEEREINYKFVWISPCYSPDELYSEENLKYILVFFQKPLWLMARMKYSVACREILFSLEFTLREILIKRLGETYLNKRGDKRQIRELTLGQIKNLLSDKKIIPKNSKEYELLQKVNEIRKIYVHNRYDKIINKRLLEEPTQRLMATIYKLIKNSEKTNFFAKYFPETVGSKQHVFQLLYYCIELLKYFPETKQGPNKTLEDILQRYEKIHKVTIDFVQK